MRLPSVPPAQAAVKYVAPLLALLLSACGGSSATSPSTPRLDSETVPTPAALATPAPDAKAPLSPSTTRSSDSTGLQAGALTLPVDTAMPSASDFAAGRILVRFEPTVSTASRNAVHARLGGAVSGSVEGLDVQIVAVPAGQELARVAAYSREPGVRYAEPDYTLKALFTPNDTYYATRQWDMPKMALPVAWDATQSNNTIKVAVLDTGIDLAHGDVAAKVVASRNFTSTSTSVQDGHGHGTHCSGTVAAITNNAKGVAGVAPDAALLIGKVLSDSGSGSLSWVASGVGWARTNGAKVISMSLGAPSGMSTLRDAIDAAWNAGVVVVAAAGNSNTSSASYPAYYTNCIAVAATDSSDRRASFSNYGAWVDVAAPGVSIYSTYRRATGSTTDRYAYMSGTSMACPHVAGLAALVWASPHGTSAAAVRARIQATCDPATTDSTKPIGAGRVNAAKAVAP